jgi:hypothetical protein
MSVREILKKSRPRVFPVEISCGTVYVRGLSGAGRQKFIDMNKAVEGIAAMHHVAALGLCEEDGTLCFDISTDKGLVMSELELKDMDGADLGKIVSALYEASGLMSNAEKDAEKK